MDQGRTQMPPARRSDIRREREAEALRENLRKRKDQQRARVAPAAEKPRTETPDDKSGEA
jgi:hypothetical protein